MTQSNEGNGRRFEIGILGGTGLYEIEGISEIDEVRLQTPFGEPSDVYVVGSLEGKRVAFLARHGRGHRLLPSEINYRANIYGFRSLGVRRIIAVNSVGSLKEDIKPRDVVMADQFFDRTRRKNTFFGQGIAAHVSFAHPVCHVLSSHLLASAKGRNFDCHFGGTYLCIEGPSFSSKAESEVYRTWGCDVIGMTAATEAKLCREAEICYATLNLVTDYDVWHEEEESVSVELILENLHWNVNKAKAILKRTISRIDSEKDDSCDCGDALKNAIVTHPDHVPEETFEKVRLLVAKYLTRK